MEYISTKELAKQGVSAVAGIAGGAALLAMGALPSFVGVGVGLIAGIAGICSFFSKDPDDRKAGAVLAVGGALAVASKVLHLGFAGVCLGLGGLGLLAMGVWRGIKFLKGLKSRG
ncbi:MAG: hypothetical protein LBG87_07735 [Spirochaetaceae bacterium]|jgi:hypothetical protein|nr:hypothetical protein [Spirochaetaceae bacterium]